ncbi:aryl-alcohol dehydrogenase-like predicted oxidoreductase [Rhodococcus sp. 27YEA15]
MHYVRLGNSGRKFSAVVLGCMSFGHPDRGTSRLVTIRRAKPTADTPNT